MATGEEKTNHLRGQVGTSWALAFSPDGQQLASGGRDSPIKIWRVDQSETMDELRHLHSKDYGNFAFAPNGKSMAAGFEDVTVKLFDVESMKPTGVLTGMQFVVAFSGDSRHLLASKANGVAYWWDVEAQYGQPLPAYSGNLSNVICADLSSDGSVAALGHADGMIQLLEVLSGKTLWMFQAHSARIRTLRFSPDARKLVSGGSDHAVALWDVERQSLLARSEEAAAHKGAVCAAVISRDGKRLASGCGAGTIKLWLPQNLTNALVTIACHKSALRSLDFCPPDSATLASGGEDNIVKLWNVMSLLPLPSQGPPVPREVASFSVSNNVRLVEFSPDGNVLAVVSDGGVLRLLRAISKEEADQEIASLKP